MPGERAGDQIGFLAVPSLLGHSPRPRHVICANDPQDPDSIARYLRDAYSFDGDHSYPWRSEFSWHVRRIGEALAFTSFSATQATLAGHHLGLSLLEPVRQEALPSALADAV